MIQDKGVPGSCIGHLSDFPDSHGIPWITVYFFFFFFIFKLYITVKMSLMSARIHKARMELEGAQLLEVFKELDDGDLKEDGGGGDEKKWMDLREM